MKTKVRVTRLEHDHGIISVGDEGYIDSYVSGNHNRPLAMVVVGKIIESFYPWELEVITDEESKQQQQHK